MIEIVEVGPRDGLQNEKAWVPTEAKIAFVNALNKTGTRQIEVTAFVSPKWVPQLKDAKAVLVDIERSDGIEYSALVPNLKGFERAMGAKLINWHSLRRQVRRSTQKISTQRSMGRLNE